MILVEMVVWEEGDLVGGGKGLKLATCFRRVTLHTADLTMTKVGFCGSIFIPWLLVILPVGVRLSRSGFWGLMIMVVDIDSSDWKRGHLRRGHELCFMIYQLLMDLRYCWWSLASFNPINNYFVIIRETFEDVVDLIFMFNYFPKQSKLIESGCEAPSIFVNSFGALCPFLELVLEFFLCGHGLAWHR